MKVIFKNCDLKFSSKKKKFFTELLKASNPSFGGGYSSGNTENCSINENTIVTDLENASINFVLENNHTYLIGAKCQSPNAPNAMIKSSNEYNVNGVMFADFTDNVNTKVNIVENNRADFKYICFIVIGNRNKTKVPFEFYIYDITGEDRSKFQSLTFDDLKQGKISIYVDEV